MQDHNQYRLFLHLAATLSFTRTAADCHVSPATLSRTVQRLEAATGHRLLDRGPHGVALTEHGHRFRRYAAEALELWNRYCDNDLTKEQLNGDLRCLPRSQPARACCPTCSHLSETPTPRCRSRCGPVTPRPPSRSSTTARQTSPSRPCPPGFRLPSSLAPSPAPPSSLSEPTHHDKARNFQILTSCSYCPGRAWSETSPTGGFAASASHPHSRRGRRTRSPAHLGRSRLRHRHHP